MTGFGTKGTFQLLGLLFLEQDDDELDYVEDDCPVKKVYRAKDAVSIE
jgi:hypothetical protein